MDIYIKRTVSFVLMGTLALSLWGVVSEFALPSYKGNTFIIRHLGYVLQYNERYEEPDWVAYKLTKKEAQTHRKRKGEFREDPLVTTGSATPKDYAEPIYDRGHMAPSADMAWSLTSMSESFYMSNVCPQHPDLNRKAWKDLEELVRDWAIQNDELYIVSGPIINPKHHNSIGDNKVAVPDAFYKVILDAKGPVKKGIAFILPNEDCPNPLPYYAVSIKEVEKRTGLHFFPQLPSSDIRFKTSYNLSLWSFTPLYESKIKQYRSLHYRLNKRIQ